MTSAHDDTTALVATADIAAISIPPPLDAASSSAISLPTPLLNEEENTLSAATTPSPPPFSSYISSTSASTMAMRTLPAVPPPVETAMPGALGQVLVFVLHTIPSILFWVIGFATITLPTWLFTLFSMSLTFTMNFTTLMIIFFALMSTVIWFIRYRYLTMYSRLPPEPQRKEPQIDLFPDTQEGDSKPGLANYLDEFLSAIKVFGYLERPVFHELTRTMQTRKLMAGETLLLEEEKGFCLVVDGLVQIFVKSIRGNEAGSNASTPGMEDTDDEDIHQTDGNQGYQLLTEVKNGASMSSLFSILTLFTEDVHLRQGSEDSARNVSQKSPFPPSMPGSPGSFARGPQLGSPPTPHTAEGLGVAPLPTVPPLDLEESAEQSKTGTSTAEHSPKVPPPTQPQGHRQAHKPKSVHPDIVARAMVDTTIAIIPASAFRRLTRMYPRATAHIVQVILTRLQRVTFSTAHAYLGLDTEVLSIDRQLHKFTAHDLPNDLRGSALERLKDKFRQERERLGPNDDSKGIALHNPQAHRRRRSSSSLLKEVALQTKIAASRRHLSMSSDNYSSSNVNPGDLLSTIQLNRYGNRSDAGRRSPSQSQVTPFAEAASPLAQVNHSPFRGVPTHMATSPFLRRESLDEDAIFRESLVECMMKGIGLTSSTRDALRKAYSGEQSPKLVSYDSRRQKAVFNNAFGFMDPFDDADSESMMSMSVTSAGGTSPVHNLREELRSEIEIVSFPQGSVLVEQGERNPGGMQGYVGSVASYRSFTDVVAKTDVYLGFLPRATLERIAERYPIVLLTLAKRLTSVLPRLILHIDFALEWVQVTAGQVIHHQGDDSDAIYIVLNGRLRSVLEGKGGKIRVLGEYGQGESVGELEVMTESTRPATLHAIRDTELAKFPRSLFNSLAQEHPGITIQISKLIAQRMRDLIYNPLLTEPSYVPRDISTANTATSTVNMRTVAILPVTVGVPVVEFGNRLMNAFTQIGVMNGVTSLNQAAILNHLGRHAFSKMGKLKLAQYLADLEEKYGMVLYIADTNVNSPWTQTCITQADCILLVGLAEGSSAIGEYERFLLGMKTTARKELVLLHAERYCPAGLTRRWLKNRVWINGGHHHVQMSYHLTTEPTHPRTKRFGTALKQRVQVIQAEIQKYTSRRIHQTPLYSQQTPFKGDFHRLARRLCGKSVGLVLGGGGARGIAHVGVIKAIEEAGIPIDIVGGTSIGSFIGALYARDADVVPMYGRAKKFAGRMGSIWRFALDVTYPAVSYTTGHEFNRGIFKTFGDSQIEDFWLEFYCNTTNISKSRNEFHSSGYVWRYVRASMSLAGLLPPLCDEGSLLLDGGYVDNLTVAHMKSLGADIILAVDVGSLDDNTPQDYGDTLSGFWTFVNRWNPFSSTPNPITLSEIQARLAYVSSVDSLERAKIMPGCLYMRPPIDPYGTLEFGKFDEIYEVGYTYGKKFLDKLRAEGTLPVMEESTEEKKLRRTMAPRRASI
uniref:Lysophospholipase NTE1 n=1 Tax=Talaromyces marneffei PM1 TaxID=1077442 RepID=A0A093UXF5_TALMA